MDHGRSNELMNPCPEWIHRFIILICHDPSDIGSLILIRIISKERTYSVLAYLVSGIFYHDDIPYKVLFFFSSLFIKYSQKPWLKTKAMIPAYWKTTLKTLRTFGMNYHIFSLQSLIHSHPFSNIYIEIMAVHQIHYRLFKTFKKSYK